MTKCINNVETSICLLVDNGSLNPDATLNLRKIAKALSAKINVAVRPVSLLHSSNIDKNKLENQPAEIFEPLVKKLSLNGVTEFLVIPFFLGPSAAITDYLPKRALHVSQITNQFTIRIGPSIVDPGKSIDLRIAKILEEKVTKIINDHHLIKPKVILVDHGTPSKPVNEVRRIITVQLKSLLIDKITELTQTSMERRAGSQYDFNEPLLKDVLSGIKHSSGDIIVAFLFLSPGNHAGENGDIAQICNEAKNLNSNINLYRTESIGNHEKIISILAERYYQTKKMKPLNL